MIQVNQITKQYSGYQVLTDVSFTARDGAVTGFVGPNGAGKSTLLNIVAGRTAATSGTVSIDGQRYASAERPGATLGAFLSAEWIPEYMTAFSYLSYLCDLQGVSKSSILETLTSVGFSTYSRKKVMTFSLGMRQRLGIAGIITSDPKNLILDEPINGLDPTAIAWLREFVSTAAQRGKAVILSSHHMAELSLVADYMVVLDSGRVVRQGPMEGFLKESEQKVYVESSNLPGFMLHLQRAGFEVVGYRAGALVSSAVPAEIARLAVAAGEELNHLSSHTRSLEETYFDTIDLKKSFDLSKGAKV